MRLTIFVAHHLALLSRTYSAYHPSRNKENQRWSQLGVQKAFRRLHSDAVASNRLEILNINSSLEVAAHDLFIFERIASSLPLSLVKDSARYSIMESSQADVASLRVSTFQSQIFLYVLCFDQLYAYVPLFSSKSSFLSNDVGHRDVLIGR